MNSKALNCPAHPRACGENLCQLHVAHAPTGSSPRMRGKLASDICATSADRLIPAHAGKTWARPSSRTSSWAHPRACGENDSVLRGARGSYGSSPRMRGKRGTGPAWRRGVGLIPAHAGKTFVFAGRATRVRAHPRACGENVGTIEAARLTGGSSPRMRGKPFFCCFEEGGGGAHPRACGENSTYEYATACQLGSSPRMRGKHWMAARMTSTTGLIPAHAGKTMRETLSSPAEWAHPRACGENGETIGQAGCPAGSSPRMRGKRRPRRQVRSPTGLIPAHAGKTVCSIIKANVAAAHPRACGENG